VTTPSGTMRVVVLDLDDKAAPFAVECHHRRELGLRQEYTVSTAMHLAFRRTHPSYLGLPCVWILSSEWRPATPEEAARAQEQAGQADLTRLGGRL